MCGLRHQHPFSIDALSIKQRYFTGILLAPAALGRSTQPTWGGSRT
jgi:hypothetical protein